MPDLIDHIAVIALLFTHWWFDRRGAAKVRERRRHDEARLAAGQEPFVPDRVSWLGPVGIGGGLALVSAVLLWRTGAGETLRISVSGWGVWAWIGAGAVFAYLGFMLVFLNMESVHVPHCEPCREEWRKMLRTNASVRAHSIGVPGSARNSIIGGAAEEFVWRGYLWWYVAALGGDWAALAATAVLFGVFHRGQGVGPWSFATVAGAVLGVLRLVSGGVWLGVFLHAGHNGVVAALCASARRGVRSTMVDENCECDCEKCAAALRPRTA